MPEEEPNPPTPPTGLPEDVTQYDDDALTQAEITELEDAGIDSETLGTAIGQSATNGTSDEVKRLRQVLRAILAILHLLNPG